MLSTAIAESWRRTSCATCAWKCSSSSRRSMAGRFLVGLGFGGKDDGAGQHARDLHGIIGLIILYCRLRLVRIGRGVLERCLHTGWRPAQMLGCFAGIVPISASDSYHLPDGQTGSLDICLAPNAGV